VKALLRRIAGRAPAVVGSPWTFLAAVVATLGWVVSGVFFDWSGGWVLWPATLTSVGAFLLVLLLQFTQNRDTRAIQLKLDELIRSFDQARTQLVRLEALSDEELAQIEDEFRELRSREVSAAAESEYEDMATTTTDHDEIRRWVEERGGRPTRVRDTGSNGDPGILRINFDEPGGDDDDRLEEIDWDEWFRAFEENRLAFLYEPDDGSRFNKLVSRDKVDER
jgi:low affinity Fe/Cu permease